MELSSIRKCGFTIMALALLAGAPTTRAEETVTVNISLKDHRFQPAEVHAPAGKSIVIVVKISTRRRLSSRAICFVLRKSLPPAVRSRCEFALRPRPLSFF